MIGTLSVGVRRSVRRRWLQPAAAACGRAAQKTASAGACGCSLIAAACGRAARNKNGGSAPQILPDPPLFEQPPKRCPTNGKEVVSQQAAVAKAHVVDKALPPAGPLLQKHGPPRPDPIDPPMLMGVAQLEAALQVDQATLVDPGLDQAQGVGHDNHGPPRSSGCRMTKTQPQVLVINGSRRRVDCQRRKVLQGKHGRRWLMAAAIACG